MRFLNGRPDFQLPQYARTGLPARIRDWRLKALLTHILRILYALDEDLVHEFDAR